METQLLWFQSRKFFSNNYIGFCLSYKLKQPLSHFSIMKVCINCECLSIFMLIKCNNVTPQIQSVLEETLQAMDAKAMVVGHTPQTAGVNW